MDHPEIDPSTDDRAPASVPLIITDVQTQKKRAERRSIFINGEFAFGVSEETYVRYALFKGREVTREYLDELLLVEENYQARQCALRYLDKRMRSVREITKKLAEKGFDAATIASTLEFLREYRMIDDHAFARAYVNDQLLRRPLGRQRLALELRRKGITKESATALVHDVVGDDDELANALAAAEKKVATLRHDDVRKRERSLTNFLAARGFSWDVITTVVRRLRPRMLEGCTAESEDNDTSED